MNGQENTGPQEESNVIDISDLREKSLDCPEANLTVPPTDIADLIAQQKGQTESILSL